MWPASLTSAPRVLLCVVTNYNNVVEARSDSDDEDKLHIVEEEGSLADGADCDSTLPDDEHLRGHCWDRGETRHSLIEHVDLKHTSALSHAKQTSRLPTHHFHTVLWLLFLHWGKVHHTFSFHLIFCNIFLRMWKIMPVDDYSTRLSLFARIVFRHMPVYIFHIPNHTG